VTREPFAVAWTGASRWALRRLPEKAATVAVEFVYGSLVASPRRVGKPLRLGLEGLHNASGR
jgi:mRNA interferase RelE/StbE